ncbi:CHASE2 domain-containing protein [bacterium SCSIO 12741]|nr:CHASE2 domain-containing protein [bacterium SCSIO 12741]
MKYLFRLDSLICTSILLGVVVLLSNLNFNVEVFDPVAKAFEDFEISDVVFTQPKENDRNQATLRPKPEADTSIVLVNIGMLDRGQIAKQIDVLNKHEPAIIAIDAFFRKEKDPMKDFPLAMALANVKNLVLVSELHHIDSGYACFDSLSLSNPIFNEKANNGFANVVASSGTQGFRTVKKFSPVECLGDSSYPNFSTKIAQLYDPEAYEKLIKRGNEEEVINWRGHYSNFYALDAEDVMNEKYDLSFIKGKIVLMGYMGVPMGNYDLVDIFYTPQNHRVAGRSYPDTYGVVVHANIISMILHGNYLHEAPEWVNWVLIFIIVYLNICFFIFVAEHKKIYYDLITKSVQILEMMLLMFLIVILMLKFEFKFHLSTLIVAIFFSGDFTELYMGSLKPITLKLLRKLGFGTQE